MMDIPQATFSEKKSAIELCFAPDKYLPRRGAAVTVGLSSLHPTCFQKHWQKEKNVLDITYTQRCHSVLLCY